MTTGGHPGHAGPGPQDPSGGPEAQDGRPVAAFDFDGTITGRDTMLLFLTAVRSRATVARVFARRSPRLIAAVAGGATRDRAKRLVCRDLLNGLSVAEAEAAARRTAERVVRTSIRADTASRLRWHLRQGHRVIVVSASFDSYVGLVAGQLGVDEVVATRWEVGDDGVLTGRLAGPNVRAQAKVERLGQLLGEDFRLDYAYGNSSGDTAMLARARQPVWVGRRVIPELA